ncbi:DUF1778 domain-containing protein [Desulfovibrio inopinatus]|uniref:type II toxin-antitoxin system TacA family antitoxin n=1 Tax=Desulfovibrio inopinatus TaxID=102109 RepID=UPI00041765E3|nr:DUF1778 domain-containing protein [Desulfovibrio inopinatus]
MPLRTEPKSELIDIRTTAHVKRLLQEAAAAKSKTVTEFILDVALAEATEIVTEQRLFQLKDTEWTAFQTALDAPTTSKPRLEALLNEPSVFE